ncbi:MAG: hypothetical protein KDK76_01180 [Chlamydiia bacterium]|nr:hypothetical protein [Chlamydiia bacterium]
METDWRPRRGFGGDQDEPPLWKPLDFIPDSAKLSLATVVGGAACVLGGSALWYVGGKSLSVTKEGIRLGWDGTKWIAREGFQGTKYAITQIPTGAVWAKDRFLDLGRWSWSCIRHPLETGKIAFQNSRWFIFEMVPFVILKSIDHIHSATFSITTRTLSILKEMGEDAAYVAPFLRPVGHFVQNWNPISLIFYYAPSLKNPWYGALALACSFYTFPRKHDVTRFITLLIGTILLAPPLAKSFSNHLMTKGEAFGWGAFYGIFLCTFVNFGD